MSTSLEIAHAALCTVLHRITNTLAEDWVSPNPDASERCSHAQYNGTLAEFIFATIQQINKADQMNIDLNQDEIQLILRNLPQTSEEGEKLGKKLLHYIFPEVDQDTIAEKWQEWKKK